MNKKIDKKFRQINSKPDPFVGLGRNDDTRKWVVKKQSPQKNPRVFL
jgi:hypothetical protein